MQVFNQIPAEFTNFLITGLLSLLIGLEQRKLSGKGEDIVPPFGTDRTFTFIGLLGFILYILEPKGFVLFIVGAIALVILMCVYYYTKIRDFKSYGFTIPIVALITYSLGPLIITQPKWFSITIVVAVLILVERKEYFEEITKKIDLNEFTTLAKFLIIAGVVLPIVPKDPPIPYVNISAYQIWITIVVVSSISYLSFLLHRYVFKKKGVYVSGILGGLYSSTATTLILAKQSKSGTDSPASYASAMITATSMMYIRIIILMFIFNAALGMKLLPYFGALIVTAFGIGVVLQFVKIPHVTSDDASTAEITTPEHANPLEMKTALLFGALFVAFSFVTHFVVTTYGDVGLNILSYVVGFTDIDPFLMNLFQSKTDVGLDPIARATLQAIISNNILKCVYTYMFAGKSARKIAILAILGVTILNIIFAIII